jgi:hypothetical protein
MKFKIYGEWANGEEDCLTIEGDTIEEIREKAEEETSRRGWQNCWSEQVEE